MTRHIIATALATALVYLIGAFIAWDWWWASGLPEWRNSDRFLLLLVVCVPICFADAVAEATKPQAGE